MTEYQPPQPEMPFAFLNLVCLKPKPSEEVANELENQTMRWLSLYPIPIFAGAFSDTGDLIDLSDVRPISNLMGLHRPTDGGPHLEWRILKNEELPQKSFTNDLLRRIYKHVPFRTSAELKRQAENSARNNRVGWWIVVAWVAVIPAVIATLEFLSPIWVGGIALLYSFWKAWRQVQLMRGKLKPSEKDKAKSTDSLLAAHHHYHCKANPEGFERLKSENVDRWAREATLTEAKTLEGEKTKNES